MADLYREPDHDARAILRPHLAIDERDRSVQWDIGWLDCNAIEIEAAQIGHQKPPAGVGAAYVAVLLRDMDMAQATGVHDGEAVVDCVGREQAPVDYGEGTLRFHAQGCLTGAAVDAGGEQRGVGLVLRLGEFVDGIAAGDIGLVAPVADRCRGQLRLYLHRAVRRSTDADCAALSEWDGQADLS